MNDEGAFSGPFVRFHPAMLYVVQTTYAVAVILFPPVPLASTTPLTVHTFAALGYDSIMATLWMDMPPATPIWPPPPSSTLPAGQVAVADKVVPATGPFELC
jgi:hypothetical protein